MQERRGGGVIPVSPRGGGGVEGWSRSCLPVQLSGIRGIPAPGEGARS